MKFSQTLNNKNLSGLDVESSKEDSSLVLERAKVELANAIRDYNPATAKASSSEEFRQVANGVFQSEGTVSARIRKDQVYASPVVTLGQNFTPEALKFFVRLYYEIGQVGRVRVETTSSGKVYIKWTSESWKDILGTVANYFSDLYGEKYIGFKKLVAIYALMSQSDEES